MHRLKDIWKDDTVLLNSFYDKDSDTLVIVTKSNKTDNKTIHSLDKPKVPVFIINNNIDTSNYLDTVRKEDCKVYWVSEKWREGEIAEILGMRNYYAKIKDGQINNGHIYLHKRVMGSDKPIEDLVMIDYVSRYTVVTDDNLILKDPPIVRKLHIGALDIESEIKDIDEHKDQPVNVITYIDNKTWTIKTVALRDNRYKGQKSVENDIAGFELELMKLIRHQIETLVVDEDNDAKNERIKNTIRPILPKLKLELSFTNSEANLIREVNNYVFDKANPDYLMIYNAAYDIGQQKLRSKELNVNFDNLFKFKTLKPITNLEGLDRELATNYRFEFDPKSRKLARNYNLHNPTKILDQWLLYYKSRPQQNFSKTSLDVTVKREVGMHKLDYSHICNHIEDLAHLDYRTFLLYNIVDVLVMLFLEEITKDVESALYTRFDLVTEWPGLFVPSRRTMNDFDFSTMMLGYIPSNNINPGLVAINKDTIERMKEKGNDFYKVIEELQYIADLRKKEEELGKAAVEDEIKSIKVKGGFCTNPNLIDKKVKDQSLFGGLDVKMYNKISYCADNDAWAMYPTNMIANNSSRDTFYGAIKGMGDKTRGDEVDIAEWTFSVINKNLSSIGKHYYGLPSAEELMKKYYGVEMTINKDYNNKVNKSNVVLKELSKLGSSFISWYNSCYVTKYTDKDKDSGAPSANKLLVTSDNDTVEFSYYGTKVSIQTNKTTNEILDISGIGINCGIYEAKTNTIVNKYDDYMDHLKPKNKDPQISTIVADGELDFNQLDKISKAKYVTTVVDFGGTKLPILNRIIFSNYKSPIKWVIYNIEGNKECRLLRLYSQYRIKHKDEELNINVEQKIIYSII